MPTLETTIFLYPDDPTGARCMPLDSGRVALQWLGHAVTIHGDRDQLVAMLRAALTALYNAEQPARPADLTVVQADEVRCSHGGDCEVPGHPKELHGDPSPSHPGVDTLRVIDGRWAFGPMGMVEVGDDAS